MKKILCVLSVFVFGLLILTNCSGTEYDVDVPLQTEEESNGSLKSMLILQPASNKDEVHLVTYPEGLPSLGFPAGYWGWSYSHTRNGQLTLTYWTNGGYLMKTNMLLKFDLTRIYQTDVIKKATLSLYSIPTPVEAHHNKANTGTNNSFYVRRVTSTWSTGSIQQFPVTTTSNQVVVPHTNLATLDVNIDVTKLVRDMVANRNNGFLLSFVNPSLYTSRYFCNSGYATAAKRPMLSIEFE